MLRGDDKQIDVTNARAVQTVIMSLFVGLKAGLAGEIRNDRNLTKIHLGVHLFMRLLESRHPRAVVASASLARVRRHDVRRSSEEILALRIIVVLGARTHIMCV